MAGRGRITREDPVDRDGVYVLSFLFEKSTDGGRTFRSVPTRHADIHDLWIDPADPKRMIVADDGGGSVSVNGGATWTEQDYPTAQIYRLATTSGFPYKLCGAQQDDSTVCVNSRPASDFDDQPHVDYFADFQAISGSESGYVAPHPTNPDLFFVGATNDLERSDARRGWVRDVQPYPYSVMGQPANSMKERWNWSYPLVFSPLAPHALYAGSQYLWRSRNEGESWEKISPDLTGADPATLGETGGPIRPDQDGPEVYGTLFTIAPSPTEPGVIWTGSDDGVISLTRDDGATWRRVTPRGLPKHSRVSFIHASAHAPGAAFAAVKRYELGDRRPYLYATRDYGANWARIDRGLPAEDFVHGVAEDAKQPGLLFVGTEHGVHVSFDAGRAWRPLSLNLPDVHVSGIKVVGDELAIATHGRSFHVLEGLPTLRHLAAAGQPTGPDLFPPADAVLSAVPATFNVFLPATVDRATLTVKDAAGAVIRTLRLADPRAGGHSVGWDLRHDGATVFENMILEAPSPRRGPWALPGRYEATLFIGDRPVSTRSFMVALDPRVTGVQATDLQAQHALAIKLRDSISRANETVLAIRALRTEIAARPGIEATRALLDELAATENLLYQTRNQSPKDKIAFSIALNDRLANLMALVGRGPGPVTAGQRQVDAELHRELDAALARFEAVRARSRP